MIAGRPQLKTAVGPYFFSQLWTYSTLKEWKVIDTMLCCHFPDIGKDEIKKVSCNIDEGSERSLQLCGLATVKYFIFLRCNWAVGETPAGQVAGPSSHTAAPTLTSQDASHTETKKCGDSSSPSHINWMSFILQMPLSPSLLRRGFLSTRQMNWILLISS